MAELNASETATADPCCTPEQQSTCCDPSAKAECCGHEAGCGCVINLPLDKPTVLREVARVLRPGGRFAVSDVITDENMDDDTRADMQAYTGCIAGALTDAQFTQALADAGSVDVEIRVTHRVHAHAASAIERARKPAGRA
jgi:SAM-dependent methyltransferase